MSRLCSGICETIEARWLLSESEGHSECWSEADWPDPRTQGSPELLCNRTDTAPDWGENLQLTGAIEQSGLADQSLDHGWPLDSEVLDSLEDID